MKDKKTFYMSKRILSRLIMAALLMNGTIDYAKAQSIHAITVQDALELAKKNNIAVKTARTNLQIQEQTNKALTADALPEVSGTITTTAYLQLPVSIIPKDAFAPGQPAEAQAVSFTPKYNAT